MSGADPVRSGSALHPLNWSITRKLIAAFGVVVLATAGSAWLGSVAIGTARDRTNWNLHAYEVLDHLEHAGAAMVNQETGLRGYLLAGEASFLGPFHAGREEFSAALRELRRLTADNPQQQARLAELASTAASWTDGHAGRAIALMADPASRTEAIRLEASGAGKAAMDAVRGRLVEIGKVERDLLATRRMEQIAAMESARDTGLIGAALAFLSAILGAFVLSRAVIRPVQSATMAMSRMAADDLDLALGNLERGDELGAMARALETLRTKALQAREIAAEAAALRGQAETARVAAQHSLATDIEAAIGGIAARLADSAAGLKVTSDGLARTAERTVEETTAAAAGATQASANVQTVAASAEEMAASIGEINRQVTQAAEVARRTAAEAQAADGTMGRLAEGAQRIGDVVRLIGDIAGQTNLLALNATIEAARAGEAGKGFAVVASEVKALAAQTAKATDEIGGQIATMQEATNKAVEAIKGIGGSIERSSEITAAIAAAVEQQGAATQEIARSVAEAARGTGIVSQGVERLNEGATETSGILQTLRAAGDDVARQGDALRASLAGVVSRLRQSAVPTG